VCACVLYTPVAGAVAGGHLGIRSGKEEYVYRRRRDSARDKGWRWCLPRFEA